MLRMSLLGTVDISFNQTPVIFRTRKEQALLIYLALEHGEPHWREALMDLLWPHSLERAARANLRQLLSQLRRDVPVWTGPDGADVTLLNAYGQQKIRLDSAYPLQVDALELRRLLRGAISLRSPNWHRDEAYHATLEQAGALYRGPFLHDFFLKDSDPFEHWAQTLRTQLRGGMLDTLSTLAEIHLRRRQYDQARAFAEKQRAIDPLCEGAFRQLMEVYARSGRTARAMALYAELTRRLRAELGLAPTAQTAMLAEQIRGGSLDTAPAGQVHVRGYELGNLMTTGTFGTVYQAHQKTIGRAVAVKVIRARYANQPTFIRRFEGEAQIIARLEHPFIVPLYDYWREPDGAYLVMRWLPGGTVAEHINPGGWNLPRVVTLVDQISAALDAAHRNGVVHRDLKPANILLDEQGNAYLSDFGIARDLFTPAGSETETENPVSPQYAAPEQLSSGAVSPQTDIYAFGLLLFELLTGCRPYGEASMAELIYLQLNEPLPSAAAQRSALPPAIDGVLQRATAKQPAARYADVLTFAGAVRKALAVEPARSTAPVAMALIPDLPGANPFRGLRPFEEADSALFCGRAELVRQLLSHWQTATGSPHAPAERFLAVVGPSGSGKSSAVKAGLLSRLRSGALPDSATWYVAEMVPGTDPFGELEKALLPVAVNAPRRLRDGLRRDARGLTRVLQRVLPPTDDGLPGQLLLVIDQFEELFTLVDPEAERARFLVGLATALKDARSQLRLIVTLRADFYDRPLLYNEFGDLIRRHTAVVLPLSVAELEEAIRVPAGRAGVTFESGLVETIINDVVDQPGGLPLLQYALTELFERRAGRIISRNAYVGIGGVSGAIARRAEAIYQNLSPAGQSATRQLLLRLVTLGEGAENTRRRTLYSELVAAVLGDSPADGARGALDALLNDFSRHRLLTFDHDPTTRGRTVEVAHEALLSEWPRLRAWLEDSRDDVRRQRRLAQAAAEWRQSRRDDSFLLRGARLNQFAGWTEVTTVALTADEQEYLEASMDNRNARRAADERRRQRELETARRLAETERRRAEEQSVAAQSLRRLALMLTGIAVLSAVLAITALFFARRSAVNFAAAEAQARIARARTLAFSARTTIEHDPELALLLALAGVDETFLVDGTVTVDAENALREAINASSRLVWSATVSRGAITAITFSPDGHRLALSDEAGVATTWSIGNQAPERQLGEALAPSFDARGERVAGLRVNGNGSISRPIWHAADGELVSEEMVPATVQAIESLWLSPNWDIVVVGHANDALQICSFTTATCQHVPDIFPGPADFLSWHPGGEYFVSGSNDSRVHLWQIKDSPDETGPIVDLLGEIEFPTLAALDASFTRDGVFLAISGTDELVQIWDFASLAAETASEPVETLFLIGPSSGKLVSDITFSADGQTLYSSTLDGRVHAWNRSSGVLEYILPSFRSDVVDLELDASGERLAVFSASGQVKVWDVSHTGEKEVLTYFAPDALWFRQARFAPDGKTVAIAHQSGSLSLWDPAGNREIYNLSVSDDWVQGVAYSPDGELLAVAQKNGNIGLRRAVDGALVRTLVGHERALYPPLLEGVFEVVFSHDGTRLASAGIDGTVRLWDVAAGIELARYEGHAGAVMDVDFSADDALLISVSTDGTVRVWDVAGGASRFVISTGIEIWGVRLCDDDSLLATANRDGNVRLYDFAASLAANHGVLLGDLEGHTGPIWDLDINHDCTRLVSASSDNTLRVWDIEKRAPLSVIPGHDSAIFYAEYSPDDSLILSASQDLTVRLFYADPVPLRAAARDRVTRAFTDTECTQYLGQACALEDRQ